MPYCERCDREFQSWRSYEQHVADSRNHYVCDDCDRDYDSWLQLKQHYINSPRHHYCRECNTLFNNNDNLIDHCVDEHHYCKGCDKFFKGTNGLHEHNRQSHWYCIECRRVFNSESNLKAHLKSSVHCPKNVPCAFQYRGCTQWFVSKSAMILHLESETCPSGANRQMIDRWVRLNDSNHIIINPSRLLEDGSTTKRFATNRSWNGYAYECVLCHNTFGTLADLNRHLASPRHEEKIYHCPLQSCSTKFSTLSALCQHVESERCGILRFRMVRDGMNNLLSGVGRLRIDG